MRENGKESVVTGGRVNLGCAKCGFEREIVLDKVTVSV